ncbi:MAG: ABC transporter ATP-binding protein [Cyanobacteria bacterium SZAS-4]|nr:ABC transporter ATP-binding protein [Cyanobacteria bacterium SZAS-4]
MRVVGVSKTYGDHHVNAVKDVSLNFQAGEFVALMGPSGCGKSTLLNLMGGIDKPTGGQVWFDEQDLTAMSDEQTTKIRGTKIGFIFQFFNLLSTLTVLENVSLPLELVGKDERECRRLANEMLLLVGLEKRVDFYPSQLSGGEMQRTAIARALVHRPTLILADEPTGNLDSENGTAVLELLRSVNSEFKPTIIMATHSQDAANYADRIIEVRDGVVFGDKQKCSLN